MVDSGGTEDVTKPVILYKGGAISDPTFST
jgi:hypothetical protein